MVTLEFFAEGNTSVNLMIYSIDGQLLKNECLERVLSGHNHLNFDISDLKPGIYLVKVMYDNRIETFKLIRE
jgi:hypothetical protein